MSRWREEATTVQARLADMNDAGSSRSSHHKDKVAKLKNICRQVETYSGGLKKDDLNMVSAVIED